MAESAEAAAPPAEEAPPPAEEAAEEPPPRELLPHEVAQQKADAARATLNRNVAPRASLGMLGADIFNEQKTVDAELEAQNERMRLVVSEMRAEMERLDGAGGGAADARARTADERRGARRRSATR